MSKPTRQGALAARLGLLFLAQLVPVPAFAWGPLAHKAIARLAQQRLAPDTRIALDALRAQGDAGPWRCHEPDPAFRFIDQDLGRFFKASRLDLGLVACWADGWRNRDRGTEAWHFVDVELDRPDGLDLGAIREACPRGDCVTGQLRAWAAVLADRQRPAAERLEALFFVVHLTADLHQPLHCATRHDHGGNQVVVFCNGRLQTLHQAWDHGLLERRRLSAAKLLAQLQGGVEARDAYAWRGGNPEAWALESAVLARDAAYGALPVGPAPVDLDRAYQQRALPVLKRQMQKASIRLGWILDAAMAGRDPFDDAFN